MPKYEDQKKLATWIDYHITAVYPTTTEDEGFPTIRILQEQRFKHILYQDFYYKHNLPNHHSAWNDLLCVFSARFESDGKDMTDYEQPQPSDMKTELEIERAK